MADLSFLFNNHNDEKQSETEFEYKTVEWMGETIPKEIGYLLDRHHRFSFNTDWDNSELIKTIRLVKELSETIERCLSNKSMKLDPTLYDRLIRLEDGLYDFERNDLYAQIRN
jgi:hypothetical protein